MFELNERVDITAVTDIGPDRRSALIIDNFYQDPDSVRDYAAFDIDLRNDQDIMGGLPGCRAYTEDDRVRQNLKSLFDNLSKQPLWKYPIKDSWEENWNKTNFLCNMMKDCRDSGGGIPHSDGFDINFGAVIYLNKPEECSGGTRLYSLNGIQSPNQIKNSDAFRHRYNEYVKKKWLVDHTSDEWKVELEFEMVYNRCILYEADMLHAQWYEEGAFTEHYRIAQVLFI